MAEEIAKALDQSSSIYVAPRSSARRWLDEGLEPYEIASKLGVHHLIHGTAFGTGSDIGIALELRQAPMFEVRWAERYRWAVGNMFAALEHMVHAITTRVLDRGGKDADNAPRLQFGTENPLAYDLELQGRFHRARGDAWSLGVALEKYRQATAVDPRYGLAHAGAADCHTAMAIQGFQAGIGTMAFAVASARNAVTFAPFAPESHIVTGEVRAFMQLSPLAGEAALREAVRLDPRATAAHAALTRVHAAMGNHAEALAAGARATTLEPHSAALHALVTDACHWLGNADHAARCNAKAFELAPNLPSAHRLRALLLWQQGEHAAAREAATYAAAASGSDSSCIATLGMIAGATGDTDGARAALDAISARGQEVYVSPLHFADISFGLGRQSEAIELMQQAVTEHSGLLFRLRSPEYRPLLSHGHFQQLLQDVGCAPR